MYKLGVLLWAQAFERNVLLGIVFSERCIKGGEDVDSIYALAILPENGAEGVKRSRLRAIKLYEREVREGGHEEHFVHSGSRKCRPGTRSSSSRDET